MNMSSDLARSRKRQHRMSQILEHVALRGTVSFSELSELMGASAATIRRDLVELADRGLLARTHGGAQLLPSRSELPVTFRDVRFPDAKRAIAFAVAELIPHQPFAVAFSGGSTTASIVRALISHDNLTIVTNSLTIAQVATVNSKLKVVMTGGILRPESQELVGVLAENTFKAINIGLAILGTDGISAEGGVTTHDETEARTNNAMVSHAQKTIVAADGSKVGRLTLARVASIQQVSMLITDSSADQEALEAIRQKGVRVLIVDNIP